MKFSSFTKYHQQLAESKMDHFPEVDTFQFDPDRTDVFDIVQKLMPLLVKMGYCNMMEDKAKHEKNYALEDDTVEDDDRFKMSAEVLADSVDDVIRALVGRLEEVSTSDIMHVIKLEKSKFKNPLQD